MRRPTSARHLLVLLVAAVLAWSAAAGAASTAPSSSPTPPPGVTVVADEGAYVPQAHGTEDAAAAPPAARRAPAGPLLATVTDPPGDVKAPAVDLRRFSVAASGRGVLWAITFARRVALPSKTIAVCVRNVLRPRRICLRPDLASVSLLGRAIPARVTIVGRTIRVWVRASFLAIPTAARLELRASATYTGPRHLCAGGCTDATVPAAIGYRLATGCRARAREVFDVPGGPRRVALTFDDGPSPYTQRILGILAAARVPATFFEIGEQVSSRASTVASIVEHGNEVADHSWMHEFGPSTSSMQRTQAAIRRASGWTTCDFRPPYGGIRSGLVADAGALGMATVLWDVDTRDWADQTASRITRVASSGHTGSIVLMHDGGGPRSATAASLAETISSYRSRGYAFVTVDELLGDMPS
jgi:peptidoglycan/xylan/chitin deacetylase (PgdA/CDA1 family)